MAVVGMAATFAMPVGDVAGNPSDTTVSLITFYPGTEIYELEGHAALRITSDDMDVAVHYGVFDFNEPNFIYRFVKGETDYMVGLSSWALFAHQYAQQNRRIVSQKLNLTAPEKARLIQLLKENLLPENRTYRYNYVRDNCATRPLRMVEKALGDTILLPQPISTADVTTFRNYMRLYHSNYPWYQFGIDLALGTGIDKQLDAREKAFAPVVLVEQMSEARVGSSQGRKLVTDTTVIHDADPQAAILAPTPWYTSPTFVCWLVGLAITGYALWLVLKRHRYPRIAASVMFGLNGLVGLLVTFLVFVSVHEATSPNVNLLWLNPLCFIPAVTVWIKRARKMTVWYMLFNAVLLLGVIVAWIVGVQSPNPGFIPLVLADMVLSVLYIYKYKNIEKA